MSTDSTLKIRCHALVPCAGVGTRAGAGLPKQYGMLAGRAVVERTLASLQLVPELASLWVVLSPDDTWFEAHVDEAVRRQLQVLRCGGQTRAQTVSNGLAAMRKAGLGEHDWVLVHDAARCLVQPSWVQRLIDACQEDEVGGLLGLPVADTLKAHAGGRSLRTVDRTSLWAAQTPQMFRLQALADALTRAGNAVTDEASAMEALGLAPQLVRGDARNLKITWPEDFALAELLLRGEP
jgi:2-C-methyl-D-erythritol 4-phosphate cytidylyltransferase